MKKNLLILAVAIIVLIIIILLTKKPTPVPIENPASMQENTLVENQVTVTPDQELDTINVDAGIDEDLKTIDAEIGTL